MAAFIALVLLSGCASTVQTESATIYTTADVAAHASSDDCWTVIDQKVYNITEYINRHPGGKQITATCGIDSTAMFNGTTEPGFPHASEALNSVSTYQIGVTQ